MSKNHFVSPRNNSSNTFSPQHICHALYGIHAVTTTPFTLTTNKNYRNIFSFLGKEGRVTTGTLIFSPAGMQCNTAKGLKNLNHNIISKILFT